MRDLLRAIPAVRRLAGSALVLDLVDSVLGPGSFAVRGLLFDKTMAANWSVPWHQDLTIAVRTRVDSPGFGPWNVKVGIPHVRPPVEVLQAMLTVRLHLDDCQAGQGPLRVLPGSHSGGKLGAEATRDWLERQSAVSCLVGKGGVVLMRPLLLHASSAATDPSRRRVIHLEYATRPLPGGVAWFEAVERGVP
jgi:ectoine hydroxylase-related dioxygenase (phytanoyl-CoA dioxygenase family)